jgi:DNA helicase-2/ATP-dependent DNA helicase PcrA
VNFLEELNPEQRRAAEQIAGPVIVIAGAGSGKTRVLTYRIAYMIENDIRPSEILALTFTNKAAKEMKERIAHLVGEVEAKQLWMGTFHSIFARILRIEASKLGYSQNFTIYDSDDSKSLIKKIINELNLDDKTYKPAQIQQRISGAKNALITAELYKSDSIVAEEDRSARRPLTGEIYSRYEQRCFQAGAMDFDDLLLKTYLLLNNFPALLLKYQEKFKFILVDEYQDTNTTQASILRKLAARHENICVVGDDAQSIYSFRGASIKNILSFQKEYSEAKLFKLEQNYRSTGTIVEAANDLISKNKEQLKKKVWTHNDTGERIRLLKAHSDNEEGNLIAAEVIAVRREFQVPAKDFAILYRTNYQSRAIEEALRKKDIPYRIYGGLSFYQRKEVKDCVAYFRAVINPRDEEAVMRIINLPKRGIGDTTLNKLSISATENSCSVWEIMLNPQKFGVTLPTSTVIKLKEFCSLIGGLNSISEKENAFDLAMKILNMSGLLREMHSDKTIEGVNRYENIQELLSGIKEFVETPQNEELDAEVRDLTTSKTMSRYLQDIALLTDADKADPDADVVSLMTIHASKGLEFPFVFVCGLEENLFPSLLSTQSRADLEEERRLFYVSVTRAKMKLILSYSTSRFRWGSLASCEPSRFLNELPMHLLDKGQPEVRVQGSTSFLPNNRKLKPVGMAKLELKAAPTGSFSIGQRIQHERFGAGQIVALEGDQDNKKAIIEFETAGRKQLLLKFARLFPLN